MLSSLRRVINVHLSVSISLFLHAKRQAHGHAVHPCRRRISLHALQPRLILQLKRCVYLGAHEFVQTSACVAIVMLTEHEVT